MPPPPYCRWPRTADDHADVVALNHVALAAAVCSMMPSPPFPEITLRAAGVLPPILIAARQHQDAEAGVRLRHGARRIGADVIPFDDVAAVRVRKIPGRRRDG